MWVIGGWGHDLKTPTTTPPRIEFLLGLWPLDFVNAPDMTILSPHPTPLSVYDWSLSVVCGHSASCGLHGGRSASDPRCQPSDDASHISPIVAGVPKEKPCAAAQHVLGAHHSRHLAAKSEALCVAAQHVSGAHCSRRLAAKLEAT